MGFIFLGVMYIAGILMGTKDTSYYIGVGLVCVVMELWGIKQAIKKKPRYKKSIRQEVFDRLNS